MSAFPDPWEPFENSTNYFLPRLVPTSGIVNVFLINVIVCVCLFALFIFLRKYFADFYIPESTDTRFVIYLYTIYSSFCSSLIL